MKCDRLHNFGNTEIRVPKGVINMANNRISASISQKDREAVMEAIAIIKEKLPFLIDLTADERKSLPKLGDKSRAFVIKALEVATQNPDFLPRSFNVNDHPTDSPSEQCVLISLFGEIYWRSHGNDQTEVSTTIAAVCSCNFLHSQLFQTNQLSFVACDVAHIHAKPVQAHHVQSVDCQELKLFQLRLRRFGD
jgi:hypothetical protein